MALNASVCQLGGAEVELVEELGGLEFAFRGEIMPIQRRTNPLSRIGSLADNRGDTPYDESELDERRRKRKRIVATNPMDNMKRINTDTIKKMKTYSVGE